MSSSEIFSKCIPHTASLELGRGGIPEVTWTDVLLAIQGTTPEKEGFIRYVYMDDPRGRHTFFAGLFIEAMARRDVQDWIRFRKKQQNYKRDIETLVCMAIEEWKRGKKYTYTDQTRADRFGVSRATWARKYKLIFANIAAIPAYWEDEVLRLVRKRLH